MASKLFILLLPLTLFAKAGYIEPWGKDETLVKKSWNPYQTPPPRTNWLCKLGEKAILFHQNIISPVDGPRSNFRPTSARYTLLAIRRYGFFKGYLMGCDRLLRENRDPWLYRTICIDDKEYKFDPTTKKNFHR
ncbi:MAG: membrane protein insertion efficiency factor YidD [Simkaniaceae bacterium]